MEPRLIFSWEIPSARHKWLGDEAAGAEVDLKLAKDSTKTAFLPSGSL